MVLKLLQPLLLGDIRVRNRIFLSPLTRGRATPDSVPTDLMVEYYVQRSGAGLIITEGTGVSREGLGWVDAPGIWNQEQVEGWKKITEAVHAKGSKIVMQLWHMGRSLHSSVTGMQPVSASATTYPQEVHSLHGKVEAEQARALTKDDIKRIVNDYATASRNAIEAGCDGVQVQAANGYLLDQFLRDSTNFRTDEYGGSIENRARFLDEVLGAVVDAVGAQRVGVRLSPNGEIAGVVDSNPEPLYTHVAKLIDKHDIPWIELREASKDTSMEPTDQPKLHPIIRKNYSGKLVLNQDYDAQSAEKIVESGVADAISFGRPYIVNPDLAERIAKGIPWAPFTPDVFATVQAKGPRGYTDYPAAE